MSAEDPTSGRLAANRGLWDERVRAASGALAGAALLVRTAPTGEPGAGDRSLPPGYGGELPLSFTLRARR